jgi:hypothetical protein
MNDTKQTTAMQECMERSNRLDFMHWFYENRERLLKKEREQIGKAFDTGYQTGYVGDSDNGDDYYTETFK